MYINEKTANMDNTCLVKHIGERVDAKLIKIRWNNKLGMSEAIFETTIDGTASYVVDVINKEKREIYLHMCHAKPKTLEASTDRTNGSFQCSLSACFGYTSLVYEIRAVLVPYKDIYGIIGVYIAETYERKK